MGGFRHFGGVMFRVLIFFLIGISHAASNPLASVSANATGDSLWTWDGNAWIYKALGGGSTPTGTGFVHVTGGVQDGAAKLVETADVTDGQITLAKQANLAANSIIGNNTGGAAVPLALTIAQTRTLLTVNNTDNTSDANKPVSTATQTALDLKAPINNAAFTGTFSAPAGTVTLAMQANMATASILGRNTAGTGVPEVLSAATTKTLLSLNLVENTALSTWVGTANVTTLGTVGTGTWSAGGLATATGGIGFTAGNGGAVTQATNKSTGVTLNERMGNITMNGAALAAATIVSFTWTNSTVSAEDQVVCQHQTTGTFGAYTINARSAAGSSVITIRNNTAGSLSEAIILKCMVFDGVNN